MKDEFILHPSTLVNPAEYEKMFRVEDTHWWFAGKRRLVRVLLDLLPAQPGRAILDVGCGTGGMSVLLKEYGRVNGVDASELAIGFSARRRIATLERAALPWLPFAPAVFDLVTAFDVLYHRHIADDEVALAEIARVLKPGGRLIITDSALGALRSAHDVALQAARRYSTAEMSAKLRRAGFSVQRMSYANFLIFPAAAAWRLLRRGVRGDEGSDVASMPPWLNALMGVVYRAEAGLFRRTDLPIGTSIIALAHKL
jgi:SAM-dependent methyltransferase